jgi:hypothetical protein
VHVTAAESISNEEDVFLDCASTGFTGTIVMDLKSILETAERRRIYGIDNAMKIAAYEILRGQEEKMQTAKETSIRDI